MRAGLGYEKSPIGATDRSVRLPDSNRIWTTLGASYQYNNKLSFDLSYAHVFAKKGTIDIQPGHPAYLGMNFAADTKAHLDVISAGLTYRWDEPHVTQGTLPLVRKY